MSKPVAASAPSPFQLGADAARADETLDDPVFRSLDYAAGRAMQAAAQRLEDSAPGARTARRSPAPTRGREAGTAAAEDDDAA